MNYLENTKALFVYYKQLGDKSMAQLEEEQLFWKTHFTEELLKTKKD